MINLGVLFAFAIALLLPTEDFDKNSFNWWWLFMLSLQGLFALLQLILFFACYRHETPYWLLKFNKHKEALESLEEIYSKNSAKEIFNSLKYNKSLPSTNKNSEPTYWELFTCKREHSKVMRLGIMLHFFQQWCGINAIQFYSTGIFSSFGEGEFFARILTLAIKLISMIGVVIALLIVDRLGRKPLLCFGNIGMAVCSLLMGLFSGIFDAGVAPPIVFIALFLIFYEASAGPITWVYCGEILDAKPMSACVSSNWTFNIMVVFLFPSLSSLLGISTVFFIYSGVCFLAVIYFQKDLVETKGKSKLSIQKMLMKNT